MQELGRLAILILLLGLAFTIVGLIVGRLQDPRRAVRRALRAAVDTEPRPVLVAGRAGVGLDLAGGRVAAAWDAGEWRLVWPLAELDAVELIVDRQIVARAARGSGGRPADRLDEPDESAQLRFVFDDPDHPEFVLELWRPHAPARSIARDPEAALTEGRAWISRMEAILRRTQSTPPPRVQPQVPVAPEENGDIDRDDD
jgi:hypothetical protein